MYPAVLVNRGDKLELIKRLLGASLPYVLGSKGRAPTYTKENLSFSLLHGPGRVIFFYFLGHCPEGKKGSRGFARARQEITVRYDT